MAEPFHATRRVEFGDTDMAGIMHFAKFFNYMEEVEHEFLRSRGLSVVMMHEGKRIGWPRVSAGCDFAKPVRFEDVVDIYVTLTKIGAKALTYSFEFKVRGQVVATGELSTCCCLVSPEGIKSIPLPAVLRAKLESPQPGPHLASPDVGERGA
jgi:YbgC/YbaW family acyl-CoA thioester hydrolase